ncbi:MAG: Rhizobium phage vB RleM [Pseudomonadota bacterium]|jgi:hypothetical protein
MADYIQDEAGFKTVTLTRSYEAFGKTFSTVRLREPTYKEIFMEGLGRPQEWQRTEGGGMVLVTYPPVVASYIERVAVEPGIEALTQLGAVDSMRLERAITDFFRDMTRS